MELVKMPTDLQILPAQFKSRYEFCQRKIIWARKSGTILLQTDIGQRLRDMHEVTFDVEGIENEEEFQITLFDSERSKFKKYHSLLSS